MIKILNLYAGIGGNRKLWGGDIEVTAVEYDPRIAEAYNSFFPDDKIIVGDAHKFLLDNFQKFDFIWSSPPCPSHSEVRKAASLDGKFPIIYPDLKLWQEIVLLKHFTKKKKIWYCIENVKPYYTPIINPTVILNRHYFWTNYRIPKGSIINKEKPVACFSDNNTIFGFNISDFNIKAKKQVLRNLVNPKLGKYIFETALKDMKKGLNLL